MNVQEAVYEHLKSHGIKQTFLAERCGWSKQKTSAIVRGKKSMTADEMMAICEAVGVPFDYFYRVADSKKRDLGKDKNNA